MARAARVFFRRNTIRRRRIPPEPSARSRRRRKRRRRRRAKRVRWTSASCSTSRRPGLENRSTGFGKSVDEEGNGHHPLRGGRRVPTRAASAAAERRRRRRRGRGGVERRGVAAARVAGRRGVAQRRGSRDGAESPRGAGSRDGVEAPQRRGSRDGERGSTKTKSTLKAASKSKRTGSKAKIAAGGTSSAPVSALKDRAEPEPPPRPRGLFAPGTSWSLTVRQNRRWARCDVAAETACRSWRCSFPSSPAKKADSRRSFSRATRPRRAWRRKPRRARRA